MFSAVKEIDAGHCRGRLRQFSENYLARRIGQKADVRFVPAITRQKTVIRGNDYSFEERLARVVTTHWRLHSGDSRI